MRINKYLAQCGLGSRRKVEELILENKVQVNGKAINNLAFQVNEKKDKVTVENKEVKPFNEYVYLKLNKPKGYICSAKDEKGRKTIYDLIPDAKGRLFSVGRLDYNTEGLLLLTNDGDLAYKLTHPNYEIEKEYIVVIEGKIKESECAVLRAGVIENGKRMPEAKVDVIQVLKDRTRISVRIDEGQNRQVRRMFDAIGKTIILLKRVRIGEITLGGLVRGKYKELNEEELAYLSKI